MAKKKKKEEKDVLKGATVTIMIIAGLACFGSIISTQATLAEKREELHELEMKTEEIKSQNEEYQRLFNADDINSYKEKLAIENMNYAYPNEIRFYETNQEDKFFLCRLKQERSTTARCAILQHTVLLLR